MRNEERLRVTSWQKWEIDLPAIAASARGTRTTMAGLQNRAFLSLLILMTSMPGGPSAQAQVVACKPILSTKAVREDRPASPLPLAWRWHAIVKADTSYCATRSGHFEMDFVRIKEYAPDLQFTQKFRWKQSEFDISMDLSPDEAILDFRIGFIAPCVCREVGELSNDRVK